MSIRVVAALCLLFLASSLPAREPEQGVTGKSKKAERAAMLQTLERGKSITVGRERYQHLPEVLAVERKTHAETPQQAIAPLGASSQQIVETKGKLVVFRSAQAKPAFMERSGGTTVYPTVLNVRTGTIGVLTGVLVVKPKNMADAAGIASSHGLETVKAFPHLHTVFYRARPNVDIADITAALQSDPRVESAYPEIMEHELQPR